MYGLYTCTIEMIVKVSVQTLRRNGICDAVAMSSSAFAATAVYCRILSTLAEELVGIGKGRKVSG
jgi:hypothetical protein